MSSPAPAHPALRIGLVLLLLGLAPVAASRPAAPAPPPAEPTAPLRGADLDDLGQDHVPGELLVKFRDDAPAGAVAGAAHAAGARLLRSLSRAGVQHWRLPEGIDAGEGRDLLERSAFRGAIEYAEPNYRLRLLDLPTDPRRGDLWALHNLGQGGGTADADIDALEAWTAGHQGSASVIVAVVDSGVDYNHPDLSANILRNGSGVVGYDYVNGDADPMDDNNHGTHVAGTIGAVGNNGAGVVGVCPNVRIMPVKCFAADGTGTVADAVSAIDFAAAHGAQIINASWTTTQSSKALQKAIANSGALFVAAAGNSGSSAPEYPGGFNLANLITVAATEANDGLAAFSNFGSWVQIAAPGVSILSATRNGTYTFYNGTSMATPHVAGAAALVKADHPTWTPAQLKAQLLNTGDAKPSLAGKVTSGRRLNAARAVGATLALAGAGAPASVADLAAGETPGILDSITLSWTTTASPGGTPAYLYDLRYVANGDVLADWSSATPVRGVLVPQGAGAAESVSFGVHLIPGASYSFAVRASDVAGGWSALSNVATVSIPGTGWVGTSLDPGYDGYSCIHAYDPLGRPGVAYSDLDNAPARFVRFDGAAWSAPETAGRYSRGLSLAFSPSGAAGLSFTGGNTSKASSQLFFTSRSASGVWSTAATVEGQDETNEFFTSLVYDPAGNPSIAYRREGRFNDLKLARRLNGAWTSQTVDTDAGAKYKSLAYDRAGNPAIAYSGTNTDSYFDKIKIARWSGSQWSIQTLEAGTVGFGTYTSLAFDPTTGYPSVVHRANGQLRFLRWDGIRWDLELPGPGDVCTGMAYAPDGTAYVSYLLGSDSMLASRTPGGVWSTEVVEGGVYPWYRSTVRIDPAGQPTVSYGGFNAALGKKEPRFLRKSE